MIKAKVQSSFPSLESVQLQPCRCAWCPNSHGPMVAWSGPGLVSSWRHEQYRNIAPHPLVTSVCEIIASDITEMKEGLTQNGPVSTSLLPCLRNPRPDPRERRQALHSSARRGRPSSVSSIMAARVMENAELQHLLHPKPDVLFLEYLHSIW